LNLQFIINPSAGHGQYKLIINEIKKALSGSNVSYDIKITNFKGEATLLSQEASKDHDIIVAVGGDGTVHEVINGLTGTNAKLGIIPAGTGNGFAREFNIPVIVIPQINIREACNVILEGHIKSIDIGKANGQYFTGFAGVGYDALIAKLAGEIFGPLRGMWIYFISGMIVFNRYKPKLMKVQIDSEEIEIRPLVIAIANTKRYGGKAFIAPNAVPDDGMFDVCAIRYVKSWKVFWNLYKLFTGEHIKLPYVSMHRGKSVIIQSSEPFPIHLDGEPIDNCNEIQFDIIPNAIKIIVPKEGGNRDSRFKI